MSALICKYLCNKSSDHYEKDRLKLKLLSQSLKVKANLHVSCHDYDTHQNSNIHCIYLSLKAQTQLGTGLKDYCVSNNNFNFGLSL